MAKDIKTKDSNIKPKIMDTVARKPRTANKGNYHRCDENDNNSDHDNPENYATDTIMDRGQDTARFAGDKAKDGVKKAFKKDGGAKSSSFSSETNAGKSANNTKSASQSARNTANSARNTAQASKSSVNATKSTVQTAKSTSNAVSNTAKVTSETVKATGKGTIKTAEKTVKTASKAGIKTAKTAVNSGKVVVKTTAQTAKVTAKSAQTASRMAVHAARMTARALAMMAKLAAKAAVATAKAIATAVKALIAFIAAGGWVAVLIIAIIAVIMLILNSVLGIFVANEETPEGNKPMTEAIEAIQIEYENVVNAEIAPHKWGADEVHIDYGDSDGDSEIPANWNDTLAVYSVIVTHGEMTSTTAMVTPENIAELEEIFFTMHKFTCTAEETTSTDEDGNEITIVHIDVDFEIMNAEHAITHYSFNESEQQMLAVMTDPSMMSLYADLLGVDIYGGATGADITNIITNLPPNEKSTIIVEAALGKLGVAYSTMDCSDLSEYAYAQAGIDLPGTAAAQAQFCYENGFNVGKDELQPGDLIFWQKKTCSCGRWNEIHHVGIYVGDGMIVDASSSKGRIVYRELWGEYGNTWAIHSYARPT